MSIQWDKIQHRYDTIAQELAAPTLEASKRLPFQKEFAQLTELLKQREHIAQFLETIADTEKQAAETTDPEMQQLFAEELELLRSKLSKEQKALEDLMISKDALDNRSVFLEIRAGAGGQEAALFVSDLMKMYTNYALQRGWKVSVESTSETDLGGFREIVLYIKGKDVYANLKRESGVHRVQRVPATETQGRVHTSTATVAVLPEAEEVDVSVNPSDLRIDVYRASGAGGQHVNTTDSAVRITHIPTGIVVSCQDERSQLKNKNKAMKILKSRILVVRKEEHEAQMRKDRKEQVGTGMRAEKVRTYNFPQNRVTDHQVGITLKKLDIVIEGDLNEIVDALRNQELEIRKKQFLEQFK